MEDDFSLFDLEYKGKPVHVQKATIQNQVVFRITFEDNTKPLVIGRITNYEGQKVWSSFPEGRLKEAQEIGALIIALYRSKQ
jgi:hypothetical protein